eukprot:g722.t1
MAAILLLLLLVNGAHGHGTLLAPTPRQPESIYWYQVGCMAGCKCSGGGKETYPTPSSLNCETPKAPTLPAAERTWNIDGASPKGDWNEHMPWRAPGSSIPLDACGIASGFDPNAKVQYPHTFAKESNVKQGDKGSELPVGEVTEWEAGSTVTASWTLVVNHGGGYQYRVCPTNNGNAKVNNECFEANPLRFADDKQTVHFSDGGAAPVTLTAVDVSKGVQPAGATWRRLPIPACACDLGAGCTGDTSAKNATADYVPYGKDHAAAAHGTCTNGLQFSAAHLSKDWPEGYGYYVSELAKTTPEKKKTTGDGCATAKSEAACAKIDECAWYGPKNTCYKAKRRLKEGAKNVDQCSENKSEAPCNEVKGCAWHSPKEVCYSDGSDAKDFSGKDAVVYGDSQWWVSDTLVAPNLDDLRRYHCR